MWNKMTCDKSLSNRLRLLSANRRFCLTNLSFSFSFSVEELQATILRSLQLHQQCLWNLIWMRAIDNSVGCIDAIAQYQ